MSALGRVARRQWQVGVPPPYRADRDRTGGKATIVRIGGNHTHDRADVRRTLMGAREFFDSARAAVIDAERCRWQLDAMERQALSVSSPSLDAHVRGGERDRIGRDVAAMVDRESELNGRIESDYLLIDTACEVLYGKDGMSDGLAVLVPSPWWADAIYHRFIGLRSWPEVAELLGVTPRAARAGVRAAFDMADGYGLTATVAGVGHAEG